MVNTVLCDYKQTSEETRSQNPSYANVCYCFTFSSAHCSLLLEIPTFRMQFHSYSWILGSAGALSFSPVLKKHYGRQTVNWDQNSTCQLTQKSQYRIYTPDQQRFSRDLGLQQSIIELYPFNPRLGLMGLLLFPIANRVRVFVL